MMQKFLNGLNILAIMILGFFVVRVISDHLSIIEATTVVMLPLLLSLATYGTTKQLTSSLSEDLKKDITDKLSSFVKGKHIKLHGPKAGIPNQASFWNSRLKNARNRFILCSTTNKSWFDKSEEQSQMIAREFIRLIESNGKITILSQDSSHIVEMTNKFLTRYLKPLIEPLNKRQKDELKSKFENNFFFFSHPSLRYTATVSDDQMLLIPLMNTEQFRDESVVLEISRHEHPAILDNFLGDIERSVNIARKNDTMKLLF